MAKKPKWKKMDEDLWKRMSTLVRTLRGWRCEFCGDKSKDYSDKKQGLHTHHFYGRRNWSTRFYFDNLVSLCYGHHRMFHGENPRIDAEARRVWIQEKLGDERYAALIQRAGTQGMKRKEVLKEAEAWVTEMEELIATNPSQASARIK